MFANGAIVESQQPYRNVNTPQSNDDWKRVWDAPVSTIISGKIKEITSLEPWTPDPSCTPIVVYFDNYKSDGTPDLDVTKFTTCDKMNVYINRFDNSAYYLNYNGEWIKITNNTGVTEARVNELIQKNKQGITSKLSDKTKIVKLSDNASDYIESELITVDDIENLL